MKPEKSAGPPNLKEGTLYLIRHGAALHGQDDDARPLSPQGIAETRGLAVFLKQNGVRPDVLWSSGKKRARETARILAEALGCPLEEGHEWLLPDVSPRPAQDKIEGFFAKNLSGSLMIVSHMPLLPQLAQALAPGACGESAAIPTAGCLCLEKGKSGKTGKSWIMVKLIVPGDRTCE